MQLRPRILSALAATLLVATACGTSGTSSAPSGSASAPGSSAPGSQSTAPSEAASSAPTTSDLKIGVVTDVGTVNDKNFNEYTFNGAKEGAAAIGAPEPPVVVPNSDADYGPLLQAYVDQGFDVIVATGFNLVPATAPLAKANPETWFIGVDNDPCINASGDIDPTFADCSGDVATLLPKYIAINYAEDQAGYLAGIVAANATKTNEIGAIGGVSLCGPCIRYIQGYMLGAKSVNPDIKVKVAWVSDSDFRLGFADQAEGKRFADQFLQQNGNVDVLFQVAGLTGNGVIDSACGAGKMAIGVDVDQHESYPASQACIITSAEKHLAKSVSDSIKAIADGSAKGGKVRFDATNDGIGVSPFYDAESKLKEGTQAAVDAAITGLKDGSVTSCPEDCGAQSALPLGD